MSRIFQKQVCLIVMGLALLSGKNYADDGSGIQFFRLSAPSSTELREGTTNGWFYWSSGMSGVTTRVLRATTLANGGNWKEYARVVSAGASVTHQLLDAAPPTGMVFIPGGQFFMGATTNIAGHEDAPLTEMPQHSVTLSSFYMGETEVTKTQWDTVRLWALANGYAFDNVGAGKGANHPVNTVNWFDVVKWCNAKSEMEGLTPAYTVDGAVYRTGQSAPSCNWTVNGYRLPSEAEWEYAARGGVSFQRFSWGDTITHNEANYVSRTNIIYDVNGTWGAHPLYNDKLPPLTAPAKSFAPNNYGLYEMAGNVREMCWDWYYNRYYETSPSQNPHGADSGTWRCLRGGCWNYYADLCRSANRGTIAPANSDYYSGFRFARTK